MHPKSTDKASLVHLLLVDDDPDDCFIFNQIRYHIPNITITCLDESKHLLEFLNSAQRPHLIFLDLNMPIPNGIDCLRKIKAHPESKNIPVVVYSTANRQEIIEECYQNGADDFLTKPTSVPKLVSAISNVIGRFVKS